MDLIDLIDIPDAPVAAPADRLAALLIRAHHLAALCRDPVALDLIRLALWHVGNTYTPSEDVVGEDEFLP